MTRKELSYLEDATMHEKSIIKILEKLVNDLTDEELISFINNELDIHNKLEQKLLKKLEEKNG